MPIRAIVREIPNTFQRAVSAKPPEVPIRVARAKGQHRAYVRALRDAGVKVSVLPADDRFPDCCFVEDCALLVEGTALVTNMGISSRRGEEAAVADALANEVRLEYMAAPATLDGGDCLVIGRRIYVGMFNRTNEEGLRRVREVFGPRGYAVVPVPLAGGLHLKSACSYAGNGKILLAEKTLRTDVFCDVEILKVPADEAYAANCVSLEPKVLISDGFPATRRMLEAAGFEVIALDTSEFRKADGALTCLSILIP